MFALGHPDEGPGHTTTDTAADVDVLIGTNAGDWTDDWAGVRAAWGAAG
jgi:hypothetical protein